MKQLESLRDAFSILNKLQFEVWKENADGVWLKVLHARQYVNNQIVAALQE